MSKVYLDTQIFIYALESNSNFGDKAKSIIRNAEKNNINIVVSPLTLTELLTKPYIMADKENIKFIKNSFLSLNNLEIKDINIKIADKAAELRGALKLRTPDAIHLATALDRNCNTFYTNDNHFKNLKQKDIEIKLLSKL